MLVFIRRSSGVVQLRDGQTFTSKSQGLNFLSIKISNPN